MQWKKNVHICISAHMSNENNTFVSVGMTEMCAVHNVWVKMRWTEQRRVRILWIQKSYAIDVSAYPTLPIHTHTENESVRATHICSNVKDVNTVSRNSKGGVDLGNEFVTMLIDSLIIEWNIVIMLYVFIYKHYFVFNANSMI